MFLYRRKGEILTVVIFSIIAPLSLFLSQEGGLIDSLHSKQFIENVTLVKQILLLLGTCLTPIVLSILWKYSTYRLKNINTQRTELIRYIKSIFEMAWENGTNTTFKNLNIRVFLPHKGYGNNKKFTIRNIEGLSMAGNTKGLEFEVFPKCEGLVGRCYREKAVVYENSLSANPDSSLNSFQNTKTQDLEFVLCNPIFNKKNDIIAIFAFDSTGQIKITSQNEKEVLNMISNFCTQLYEAVPDLFE